MENIIPSCHGTSASVNAFSHVAVDLKLVLNTQFGDLFYTGDVFDAMKCFDPMLWDETLDYGNDLILAFYNAFSERLDQNNFDSKKALCEWHQFKVFVQNTYPGFQALSLWKKIVCSEKSNFRILL